MRSYSNKSNCATLTAVAFIAVLICLFSFDGVVQAQRLELSTESYIEPPEIIKSTVVAPWHENTTLSRISPDGNRFLLEISDGMPSVDRMGKPHRILAELKIDTGGHRQFRLSQRSNSGLKIFDAVDGQHVEIKIPENSRISNASWSPDGTKVAFFAHSDDATHVYLADPKTGESSQLTPSPVLAVHVTSFEWSADSSKILTVLVPQSDEIEASLPEKVHEPKVRVSRDGKTPSRTYRFLLKTPADVRVFEYYSTGQLITIDVADGKINRIGKPALIRSISADPQAETFRVTYIKKPFSYFVSYSQFGSKEVLIDVTGKELAVLNDREIRVRSTPSSRTPGSQQANNDKRNIRWRPDGAGISFLQLEPEKKKQEESKKSDDAKKDDAKKDDAKKDDAKTDDVKKANPDDKKQTKPAKPGDNKKAQQDSPSDRGGRGGRGRPTRTPPRKDRVMLWKAPFGEKDVEVVFESREPIRSINYSADGQWLFVTRNKANRNSSSQAGSRAGGRWGGAGGRTPTRSPRQTPTQSQTRNETNPQPSIQTIHAIDLKNENKQYLVFTGRASSGSRGRGRFRRASDHSQVVDLMDFDSLDPWYATMENEWLSPQDQDAKTQNNKKVDDPKQDDKTPAKQDATDDKKADDKKDEPTVGAKKGSLMTSTRGDGESVVRVSKDGYIYFSGSDRDAEESNANPAADATKADPKTADAKPEEPAKPPKSFIDRVKIETGEVERVFLTTDKIYETVLAVDGDEVNKVFTVRQDKTVVPDYFVHDLSKQPEATEKETAKTENAKEDADQEPGMPEPKQLTHNKNFTPWYNKLKVERIQVTRVDGFKFWVKVTSNPDFGEKLPAMFWFYPREFTDQETYDRRANMSIRMQSQSFRFQRPSSRSMSLLTRIGYVIVEPDMPIVGESGRMNDNFVTDLRNGCWAVIDELDKRNIIDRDRLGLGGHSYGAFGTANAMAHTPFFKAGIAGDGCYNRTLTPMSFQAERRYYWDARETYTRMSPLFYANQVSGALLMYHGMEDANTGTFPINSERMFQALDGLGKPTSMYMYPYEAHGPAAEETILDMWARWVAWLDHYVKNPQPPAAKKKTETPNSSATTRASSGR